MTNQNDDLRRTDPGFAERMLHFADVEVAQDPDTALDPQTRYLAILATLLGCQGTDEFRIQLARALDAGLTPVQVKEVVYLAVDYLGIGRVRPFLGITNEVLEARGVELRCSHTRRRTSAWATAPMCCAKSCCNACRTSATRARSMR